MAGIRLVLSILVGGVVLSSAGCSAAGSTAQATAGPTTAASLAAPTAAPTATPAATPSASAATPSASAAQRPTVSLTEWKVTVDGTIKSGKTDLTITNAGTVQHEMLIFKGDRAPSAYPTDSSGDIKEEGAGVTLVSDGDNIDPGGTQTRSVNLAPGKYLFVCNIPGHFKQGMYTLVTVAP
jgi:uncharacterized cupredoxin-like copper-binding protein